MVGAWKNGKPEATSCSPRYARTCPHVPQTQYTPTNSYTLEAAAAKSTMLFYSSPFQWPSMSGSHAREISVSSESHTWTLGKFLTKGLNVTRNSEHALASSDDRNTSRSIAVFITSAARGTSYGPPQTEPDQANSANEPVLISVNGRNELTPTSKNTYVPLLSSLRVKRSFVIVRPC